jgi:hypothetical protein
MADLVVGYVSSALLCGFCVILGTRCIEFDLGKRNEPEQEYILITKEHYEIIKKNPNVKKIIVERPQIRLYEAPLPSYSESENDKLPLIKEPQKTIEVLK